MRATWSGWAVGALALVLMQGLAGGQAVTETSATEATVLYVAVDGNDAWSGTLAESNADASDGPLATPTGACDRVRVLRAEGAAGPVRVLFRGGVYRVTEALVLSPEDGGSREAPVTYAACPGEDVVISGGRPITGWKQEDDLWTVELPDVKSGAWRFSALWVNGEYRAPARTPNEGYLYTAGKAAPLKDATTGEETDRAKTAFKFNPGDIRHWDNLEDAIVVVMHSWDTSHHRIASIDDDTNTVNFTGPTGWAFEHWGPKQRYYVEHMFEALDSPGEWYLNRKTGVLYYWPKEGEDMATTEVVAPVSHQLLVFAGDTENGAFVDHVTVEGLSFHHTEQTLGPQGQPTAQAAYPVHGAVEANGARYCEMLNCEVAHTSNYAVWLQKGCQHNRFVRNHFHDLGAGGIRVGVGGDPANNHEVTGHNLVDNNWIHDGGTIWPAAVGVKIARSSYNTVSHNEISDFYYTGVSVGWSWGYTPSSAHHNVIEYNHIHHLGDRKLSDMGGIYCLGDAPGTVLRYNLIHDVFSYSYGGWGIYPDEGSTDLLITNNIAYNCKTGGFHQHYGRDNRIVNNVFAFSHQGQIMRTREEDHISFYFTKNIVYFNNGELLGSNWNNGNFRLDRNCYWDTSGEVEFKGRTLEEWQATGQ
ncbi:MAG: right-handed parallel beta-helix repeat-containing protein, partial [bacterium]|nr:right-handed parallel beta-helix repeat-containing protein [bacterium]